MTIKKAMNILSSCDGNCKACKHWRIKTASLTDHITVYAHYCDISRKAGCVWYGERLATLKQETIKLLVSEIEYQQRISKYPK